MNAAQRLIPPQSTRRARDASRILPSVRSQAAFVRALLDEVERVAPPGSEDAVSEQLVEELARLGCRCIEVASALTAVVDDTCDRTRRGLVDAEEQARSSSAAREISQCA